MRYIIGVDEVGRGALAGPVVVAAAMMPKGWKPRRLRVGAPTSDARVRASELRDSKKLTANQRGKWNEYIRNHPKIFYALARVYPHGIERMNISNAANLAAKRAYRRLSQISNLKSKNYNIFLDGGLYLGSNKEQRAKSKWNAKTVVRGDQKFTAIKLASIIAKVHRDKYMVRLSKKYPHYGFEIHKGYGTRHHFNMIRKFGPSSAHRLTFL